MPSNLVPPRGFAGEVQKIPLTSIKPSDHNPRGAIERNENYLRLVSSINEMGVLVPIVVRELLHAKGDVKYELVDGERRFWAAKECGRDTVPAHILSSSNTLGNLRKLMFHTHMTREQWGAIAQCRALAEVYPKLEQGLRFSEKAEWVKRLAKETVMGIGTARDRIHVLSWPKSLKDLVYEFDDKDNSKDVYSYVLAIEVSVVEQSRNAFKEYYDHGHPPEHSANKVRAALLHKTLASLQTGTLSSREQIRGISPLFSENLNPADRKTALSLFKGFISNTEIQFDDLRAEIVGQLPEALREKPPKPQRVIANLRALERLLRSYKPEYIDEFVADESKRSELRSELLAALDGISSASRSLRAKF